MWSENCLARASHSARLLFGIWGAFALCVAASPGTAADGRRMSAGGTVADDSGMLVRPREKPLASSSAQTV